MRKGRVSIYKNATLFRVSGIEPNMHSVGTRRESWKLIPTKGIKYSTYLERGGQKRHIPFFVNSGWVEAKTPAK